MAAKKKSKTKAQEKRPAAPKAKAQTKSKAPIKPKAPTKAKAKAKPRSAPKRAQPRLKTPAPQTKPQPALVPKAPETAAGAGAPVATSPPMSIVRPGLQKRADIPPIGVVTVMDGDREIEQSTFYSPSGRDEYVQRWEARGYECRFTRWNH